MAAQRVFQHAGWVTRDLEPDYGLDQHVEVFDQGVATGLFFFTQVKATDEPDLHRALAVSFTASNLDYFEAVDDPVCCCDSTRRPRPSSGVGFTGSTTAALRRRHRPSGSRQTG